MEKQRTIDEIKLEYAQLCQKAGHLQYQVKAVSKDLELVNEQLLNLNLEASKVAATPPAATEPTPDSGV